MSKLADFMGGGSATIMRRQLFTANGTWTKPADLIGDQVWVTMIGGGGSGSSVSFNVASLSGSGGQVISRLPVNVAAVASVTVTVGAGGASVNGAGTNTPGNSGSPTSFGSFLSASGGQRGEVTTNISVAIENQNVGAAVINQDAVGVFGAKGSINKDPGVAPGVKAGAGLILDDSGASGGNVPTAPGIFGGDGYGAGGAATGGDNTVTSGAGAPGAVLVEWLEKV